MKLTAFSARLLAFASLLTVCTSANANAYREKGKVAKVTEAGIMVIPPRDWNRLDIKPGKFAETWTLDGEQLNDVTFFGGVVANQPIVRERSKKHQPLPKFRAETLLIEIPEILEGTYRAYKGIGSFAVTASRPERFLGAEGVFFSYEYTDNDELPRKGEARASIVGKKLFMVTFDAPRAHYFERTLPDFRALVDTATLKK
jgi:bifunctional DNA-binding transcriptional regulator/antitoxin component of YhaV-PrlF toxin-antitoxin module